LEQELQSGVESFSHSEGGAVVVIESEPSASAVSSHYEQRDGRWVGNVEGAERELSMPDLQLLEAVLAMEIGTPPIINTADGFNLAGDPVTFVGQYERTAGGITTTFDEIPRSILQVDANESPYIHQDYDLEPANQNSALETPGPSLSTEPIFTPSSATHTQESTGSKMWFETSSPTEATENRGADVIDFFTGREPLEPTPQAERAEPTTSTETRKTSSKSESFDVFTGLTVTESQVGTSVDTEAPVSNPRTIPNLVTETVNHSADSSLNEELDLPIAQTEVATDSLELRRDLVRTEVIESIPDIAILDASTEDQERVNVVQPLIEEIITGQAVEPVTEGISEFVSDQVELTEPPLIEARESLTETKVEPQIESYVSAVSEVGQIKVKPQIAEVTTPAQERIEDILPQAHEVAEQFVSPEFNSEAPVNNPVEKVGENEGHEALITPQTLESEAELLPFENVIKINEDTEAPVELPLDADSWANDFGSPVQTAPETESEVEAMPESEIHISRHVSGLLDITVTIETETPRPKTKKATKSMRAAA
jgi:hypothetical protein